MLGIDDVIVVRGGIPLVVDGKLIGAIAYAWSFANFSGENVGCFRIR